MLSKALAFENPVSEYSAHPRIYSGTGWKVGKLAANWDQLKGSSPWHRVIENRGYFVSPTKPEQIAVPAIEPNHLITQHDLVVIKSANQVHALLNNLESDDLDGEKGGVIIPKDIWESFMGGILQLTFLSTDVGKRHRMDGGPWGTLRNFYAAPGLRRVAKAGVLQEQALYYLEQQYTGDPEASYTVAVDAGMSLVQVIWQRNMGSVMRIFPGVSTVGMRSEKNVLATEKGRRAAIDWLMEKYKDNETVRSRHWSPLAALDNRAGLFKTEDLYHFLGEMGIAASYLCVGNSASDRERDFIDHAEGVPYRLFRQLFLTLAHANDEDLARMAGEKRFGPQLYPSKMKNDLEI